MIREGVILHQKHVLIGQEFWKLYQARFFCISPDFSLLKSGLIQDETMESCIRPDFDYLSSGSFGVLTEQRKQYQGKKYYRYRIL
jgi:hypothetical protein